MIIKLDEEEKEVIEIQRKLEQAREERRRQAEQERIETERYLAQKREELRIQAEEDKKRQAEAAENARIF